MDLRTAEQLNGKLWQRAKVGALLCFVSACLLLLASLMTSVPDPKGGTAGATATSAIR